MRKNVLLALTWYNVDIHRGVAAYARKHGWSLCSEPAHYSGWLPTGWEGDGIITNINEETLPFIKKHGLEAIHLGQPSENINFDTVSISSQSICEVAVDYLLERGYKRFAWFTNKIVAKPIRLKIMQELLAKEGLECVHLDFPTMKNWQENRKKLTDRIQEMNFPVALFCSDDDAAAEVITACLDHGLEVPEQVAVLGVHNNPLICDSLPVALSSVDVDFYKAGYMAAYLLDRRMKKLANRKRSVQIGASRVVSRQSTEVQAVDHPEVAKALRYIAKYYSKNITVKDIVLQTSMTEKGLSKAFQKAIGKTIGQQLRKYKLQQAEKLLVESSKSISEIAIASGFSDYHGLYEAFTKKNGITPLKFRKKF